MTITHVLGHEGDLWTSWGQWRELPNHTENDKRVHAFKCEDGRVWDAVNGWRGPARRDVIDGRAWAESAFSDDVDPAQREPKPRLDDAAIYRRYLDQINRMPDNG